jgi:hypothetical protein
MKPKTLRIIISSITTTILIAISIIGVLMIRNTLDSKEWTITIFNANINGAYIDIDGTHYPLGKKSYIILTSTHEITLYASPFSPQPCNISTQHFWGTDELKCMVDFRNNSIQFALLPEMLSKQFIGIYPSLNTWIGQVNNQLTQTHIPTGTAVSIQYGGLTSILPTESTGNYGLRPSRNRWTQCSYAYIALCAKYPLYLADKKTENVWTLTFETMGQDWSYTTTDGQSLYQPPEFYSGNGEYTINFLWSSTSHTWSILHTEHDEDTIDTSTTAKQIWNEACNDTAYRQAKDISLREYNDPEGKNINISNMQASFPDCQFTITDKKYNDTQGLYTMKYGVTYTANTEAHRQSPSLPIK